MLSSMNNMPEGGTQSIASAHLLFTEFAVEKTREMEGDYENSSEYSAEPDGPKSSNQLRLEQTHDSLAMYAGISSIAYLDAHINEFYYDHIELHDDRYDIHEYKPESEWQHMLKKYYEVEGDDFYYKPTLEKYQTILILIGEDTFDKGAVPFQHISTLVDFRNYFIHYQTERYKSYGQVDEIEHRIGNALQGMFDLNPMAYEGLPFFPDHCLSHGFAEWEFEYSKEFVVDFYEMVPAEPFPVPATKHVL